VSNFALNILKETNHQRAVAKMANLANSYHRFSGEIRYDDMIIVPMTITPEMAEKFLSINTNNRRLRNAIVERYSRELTANHWHFKPLAICFRPDGSLGNGQHSLWAVVLSGKPADFLVSFNTPDHVIAVMDIGVNRSLSDMAKFYDSAIDTRRGAVARVMKWGPADSSSHSFHETFAAYIEFQAGIDFVCEHHGSRQRGFIAPACAVAARAYYPHGPEKIGRFLEVIHTGQTQSEREIAAFKLRDFLGKAKVGVSSNVRSEVYAKAQTAMKNFLIGNIIERLQPTEYEHFPVAGAWDGIEVAPR